MAITFEDAKNKLGKRPSRKLENNTYLEACPDGSIGVRLHATHVVKLYTDGTYELSSGGWKTLTTKERINSYAPVAVCQKKGRWYLNGSDFYDGIRVDSEGNIISEVVDSSAGDTVKRKVDKMVSLYIKGFLEHIRTEGLEEPDAGDCWYCRMKDAKTGKSIGGVDHLLSHFEDEYYVPSLLVNALAEKHGNVGFVWGIINFDCERGSKSTLAEAALQAYFRKRKDALVEYINTENSYKEAV